MNIKDMEVFIASDHAGYEMKEQIKKHFVRDYEFKDFGTNSSESVDYPDFAHLVAIQISVHPEKFAILICGSGNGMSMTANKYANVRAALCWSVETAALARRHNNANILVLPARFISSEIVFEIVRTFLITSFDGGRHQKRVDKINIP